MERRTFLRWATHGLGALFGAVLGIPAIAYLIDARNRPAPTGEFKPVAKLSELEIGKPKLAVIDDIRRDAWTLHPSDVLGRVWLIKRDEKTVDAFTTTCPHVGGSINFNAESKQFVCPLHGASFNLACKRLSEKERGGKPNPAPRDMDSLDVRVEKEEGTGEMLVVVKYEVFATGEPEKKKKT
jgi:menaquinol-cytochrome c reductase iron-sulfur subunit